jgi:hypothetical protein
MKIKMILCVLMLTFSIATNVSAMDKNLTDAIGKVGVAAANAAGAGMKGLGDAAGAIASSMSGAFQKGPKIGGDAIVKATINGVGGIINVGVNVAGLIDAKQTVATILSGNMGSADDEVSINGVGGIVNVGVAVGGANYTCQSVGTIGGEGC